MNQNLVLTFKNEENHKTSCIVLQQQATFLHNMPLAAQNFFKTIVKRQLLNTYGVLQ